MSPTYTSAIIAILATVLPMLGVQVGSEQLTTTVQTIIVLASAVIIMYRRWIKKDITITGAYKS
jgi:hypothetical protein